MGGAASTEFLSWLIGKVPVVGNYASVAFGLATGVITGIHGDREMEALTNALIEPGELAIIASSLHLDSIVLFDGAQQQVISLPTLTTDEQREHFGFDTLQEALVDPAEAITVINDTNAEERREGSGQ